MFESLESRRPGAQPELVAVQEDPGTMWGFEDHVAEIMYQLLKEEGVLK